MGALESVFHSPRKADSIPRVGEDGVLQIAGVCQPAQHFAISSALSAKLEQGLSSRNLKLDYLPHRKA